MPPIPSVYTAHDIPDLIAALPALFGFTPTESLVAIATSGPRRRFGFRLRVDIPSPDDVDALSEIVVGHLRRNGAQGAILIAVTSRQEVAAELLEATESRLDEVDLIVSVRADGERYWTTEPGFDLDGVTYSLEGNDLAIVHAIAAGQEILPDRQALVDRFAPVASPRREWLQCASEQVLDEVLTAMDHVDADLTQAGIGVVGPILERALIGDHIDDVDVVRFCVWVSTVGVRDHVWELITHETARDMLRVLTMMARNVVPPYEPAVLSLAGFAAWLTGDGAQALIAIDRGLEADDRYSMAVLLSQLIGSGLSPHNWPRDAA